MTHPAAFPAMFIMGLLLIIAGAVPSLTSEMYEGYRARGLGTWGITVGRIMAILGGLYLCAAAISFLFHAP